MKVSFFTPVLNRPNFVEIQYLLLKKYCKTDFDFYVIDDSHNDFMSENFKSVCDKYGINYIKKNVVNTKFVSSNSPNGPDSCAHATQWIYDNLIFINQDIKYAVILDSDMFLINYFNPIEYMEEYPICGLKQTRGEESSKNFASYLWNGLMFFNMNKIKNINDYPSFWGGPVNGVITDVGGELHYFIKNNNISYKDTEVFYPDEIFGNNVKNILHRFELHGHGNFLHYRSATNWHLNGQFDIEKENIFEKIIKEYLNR